MQPTFCVCPQCRPKGMTLREAIRECEWRAAVRNYGKAEAERREAEKRQRLAMLNGRAR